jgi:hypothetical protein
MKFSGVFIACVNAASESTGDQARVLSSPFLPVGLKCSNTEAQRIINGFTANKEAWPFMARFQKKGAFKHYCGGVIIADNWVLSASHCFQEQSHIAYIHFLIKTMLKGNPAFNLLMTFKSDQPASS